MKAQELSPLAPPSLVILGRTVRAEWVRLWTIRSTCLLAIVASLGAVGISLIVGHDSRGEGQTAPGETVWVAVQILAMLVLLLLLAMAAVCTTADYTTGGIVPTLQWTPRRAILLTARTTVIAATVAAFGVLLALVGAVLINRIAPVLALPWEQGIDTIATLTYVYAFSALLAVGVGLLLRSTAGTIVIVFALMLILPLVLGNFSYPWTRDVAALLPGAGAVKLVLGDGLPGLTAADARVTLAAWAIGALAAGGWRLVRADANR